VLVLEANFDLQVAVVVVGKSRMTVREPANRQPWKNRRKIVRNAYCDLLAHALLLRRFGPDSDKSARRNSSPQRPGPEMAAPHFRPARCTYRETRLVMRWHNMRAATLAALIGMGLALGGVAGCERKERVLDIETPGTDVEVDRNIDTGEVDIVVDEE
jgi:hypothetical protein